MQAVEWVVAKLQEHWSFSGLFSDFRAKKGAVRTGVKRGLKRAHKL